MIESYVMRREVCLKHRKIRRETILRVRVRFRTGSGVCFSMRCLRHENSPGSPTTGDKLAGALHGFHAAIVQEQDP